MGLSGVYTGMLTLADLVVKRKTTCARISNLTVNGAWRENYKLIKCLDKTGNKCSKLWSTIILNKKESQV